MMIGRATRWALGLMTLTALAPSSALQARAPALAGAPSLQIVAAVGGQPDDATVTARGDLIWGDLARGTLRRLSGGRITTLAHGLSVPEGVVALPDGAVVIAEQGRDRVLRIDRNGKQTVLLALRPVAGQVGVDGIGWDAGAGRVLIPDSPRGIVLSVRPDGQGVRIIAQGLGRPVDAVPDSHGDILVPDEHLGTLIVITPRGTITRRGVLSTPDDVAVDRAGRVWITTLGDSGVWTIDPGATTPRRVLSGLANPQGLTLDRCGDPLVVDQNTAHIVRLLLSATSARCPL